MADFFDILRKQMGMQGQQQGLMQDNVPSGNPLPSPGAGQGLVATPEQIAESEAIARQLGIPVDTPALPPEGVYEQGIDVNANRPIPQAPVPVGSPMPVDQSKYLLESTAPDLSNSDWAVAANKAKEENDREVVHKGMFGVKGTLREVLGLVGDAFLVGAGNKPIYMPQRQREREGDAMAGMTQAPRAAVERMTAVNPELARQLGNDVATQEVAQMNAERMAEREAAARRAKGIDMLSRAAGSVNNETYLSNGDRIGMREIMQGLVDSYGLGDQYKLPETYDENWMRTLQYSGIPAQAQVGAAQRDRGLDQGDRRLDQTDSRNAVLKEQGDRRIAIAAQNAETARQRMLKSGGSASGRPRSDTELEFFRALQEVPANQRTPDENAWIKKYTGQNTGRGGGNSRPSATNRTPIRVLGKRPAN